MLTPHTLSPGDDALIGACETVTAEKGRGWFRDLGYFSKLIDIFHIVSETYSFIHFLLWEGFQLSEAVTVAKSRA